jgi:FkbM family methyltransferase
MDRFAIESAEAWGLAHQLGPYAEAILVRGPGGRFAVPVEDMYVGKWLRHTGQYAPAEIARLSGLCHGETRLLVVGAHIGALAIPLALQCRQVVAVEANPQIVELLKLNVMLNGLTNCRVIHKAASNRVETIEFVLNRVNSGGSKRLPRIKDRMYFHDNPQVTTVEAAPLDELLPNETFDVIVMDIEGSEYFALQGMQRILGSASALQVEFLPFHLRDVAGVSVADFVGPVAPHFASLALPDRRVAVGRNEFTSFLSAMYERGEGTEALFFFKVPPEEVRFP